ncbi:hypothetical protein DMB95_03290 [Campylobacter sp. MIT 12-8780]|nr:hypothetical protein DMB95_03290 [Campylobacter sp. MIT 12-8780]
MIKLIFKFGISLFAIIASKIYFAIYLKINKNRVFLKNKNFKFLFFIQERKNMLKYSNFLFKG